MRVNTAKYRARHPAKVKKTAAMYREKNLESERARIRAYGKANPERHAEKESRRRARKLAQNCICCTPAQLRDAYRQAQMLDFHVDHIWPLCQGGKHCRHNFQLLPPSDNMRKRATFTAKDAMKYFYNLSTASEGAV